MSKSILDYFGSKKCKSKWNSNESDSHSPSNNYESDNLLSQSCEIQHAAGSDQELIIINFWYAFQWFKKGMPKMIATWMQWIVLMNLHNDGSILDCQALDRNVKNFKFISESITMYCWTCFICICTLLRIFLTSCSYISILH